MIGELRIWALSLCAAGVIAALLEMLAPSGRDHRAFRMATSLFVLLCAIYPLNSLKPLQGWLPSANQNSSMQSGREQADALVQQELERRLVGLVQDKLKELGIIPAAIRIEINVSEEAFRIERVAVTLKSSDAWRTDETAQQLTHYLGLPTNVGISPEGT